MLMETRNIVVTKRLVKTKQLETSGFANLFFHEFSESEKPISPVRIWLVKIIAFMFCSMMITSGTE